MLVHRSNNVLKTVNSSPEFAASYTVYVAPVGARVASADTASTSITVNAPHSFSLNDRFLRYRPSDGTTEFSTPMDSSVTATTLIWTSDTWTVAAGDMLVNLGPDTGTGGTPDYDAIPGRVFPRPDDSEYFPNNLITTDAQGNYDYYSRMSGRQWELILDGSGVVQGLIDGFGGTPGEYNIADFGCEIDGTTDDSSRLQSAMDAAYFKKSGSAVHGVSGTVLHPGGICALGSKVLIYAGTNIRGVGWASEFKALGDITMLALEYTNDGARSHGMKDVYINGNSVASTCLYIGFIAQYHLQHIGIEASKLSGGVGLHLDGTQNTHINDLIMNKHDVCMWLSGGASNNLITNCELTQFGIYCLKMVWQGSPLANGTLLDEDASVIASPNDTLRRNKFERCLFEIADNTAASPAGYTANAAIVYMEDGTQNVFDTCWAGPVPSSGSVTATAIWHLKPSADSHQEQMNANRWINSGGGNGEDGIWHFVIDDVNKEVRMTSLVQYQAGFASPQASPNFINTDSKVVVIDPLYPNSLSTSPVITNNSASEYEHVVLYRHYEDLDYTQSWADIGTGIVGVRSLGNAQVLGATGKLPTLQIRSDDGQNKAIYFNEAGTNWSGLVAGGNGKSLAIQSGSGVADAITTRFVVDSAGDLENRIDEGAETGIRWSQTEVTAMSGASVSAASLIPAGSLVLGVSCRVTAAVESATTFDVGDSSDVDAFGAAIAVAADTTTTLADCTQTSPLYYTTATDVVLTANGSSFTAGAVRITVHYIDITAPTS